MVRQRRHHHPAMQLDRRRQQVPDRLEREEISSTSSIELQRFSPQRSPNIIFKIIKRILRLCSFEPDKDAQVLSVIRNVTSPCSGGTKTL
eukprot:superscaffoldBa00004330_g18688